MPLFILGFIVLVGLLIYAIISYISSGKEVDSSEFVSKRDEEVQSDDPNAGKTLMFPTENIDKEKHKRNIH